ncbi:MAG TPA: hypothetical protein VFZ59_19665 [Verrucomicrobiae bacterium]|nr:hypothetical protein [Verrucomicrobiae bacterium]
MKKPKKFKLRLDLLEHVTTEDILEEAMAKRFPLPGRTFVGQNRCRLSASGDARRTGSRNETQRRVHQTLEGPRGGSQTCKEKEASMNRIYQGRVSNVEILSGNKDNPWQPFDPDPKVARQKWQEALWQHHQLFQDALN